MRFRPGPQYGPAAIWRGPYTVFWPNARGNGPRIPQTRYFVWPMRLYFDRVEFYGSGFR